MTQARLRTGRVGEALACELLERQGCEIVARNARTRAGELDVVALQPGTLIFVEVKTMRTGARSGPERPALAVGPRKQLRIRRLARAWLGENRPPKHGSIRFDVIGILLDPADTPVEIEHIPNAF